MAMGLGRAWIGGLATLGAPTEELRMLLCVLFRMPVMLKKPTQRKRRWAERHLWSCVIQAGSSLSQALVFL